MANLEYQFFSVNYGGKIESRKEIERRKLVVAADRKTVGWVAKYTNTDAPRTEKLLIAKIYNAYLCIEIRRINIVIKNWHYSKYRSFYYSIEIANIKNLNK